MLQVAALWPQVGISKLACSGRRAARAVKMGAVKKDGLAVQGHVEDCEWSEVRGKDGIGIYSYLHLILMYRSGLGEFGRRAFAWAAPYDRAHKRSMAMSMVQSEAQFG